MGNNHLSDKQYWENYWNQYQNIDIPEKVVFAPFVPQLIKGKSFIEIGGFPGTFAAYFFQQGIFDVTILDFCIQESIVRSVEQKNHLPEKTIQCIECDFFTFSTTKKYDVVFSSGFVEHFEDTKEVIDRHVQLLSDNGQLLILIPNFLGLNGLIQRWFDPDNLAIHNLQSMEIPHLKKIMSAFNLQHVSVDYIGKPMVWLEPKPKNKLKRKWVKLLSYALKLFPFKGKFLSPYIIIYATK